MPPTVRHICIPLPDQKRSDHLHLSEKRIQRCLRPLESDPGSKPSRCVRRLFCEEDLSCEISWLKVRDIVEWRAPTQYRHCNRVLFLVYAVSMLLRLASHYQQHSKRILVSTDFGMVG